MKFFIATLAFVASVRAQASPYAQCGGNGWTGATTCVSGWTCVYSNDYYSQCVQATGTTTTSSPTTTSKTTTTASSTTTSKATTSSKTTTTSSKTTTTTSKTTTTSSKTTTTSSKTTTSSAATQTTSGTIPGIILIGDSTVTVEKGWGPGFCADTKGLATCLNLAVSGKTTVDWRQQTQYQTMLTSCKTPKTYATIQFGHNDQKVMTTSEFYANMTSLVKVVQSAGCLPIMVTSLPRRTWSTSSGLLTDSLLPYVNQAIAVANALGLPIVPLWADGEAYLQKLGQANAMTFNYDYPTNSDTTHLNPTGAKYFGRIVADDIAKYVPLLAPYIVADAALTAKIAAGTL